jgi:cytochrome c oxidase subunit 2
MPRKRRGTRPTRAVLIIWAIGTAVGVALALLVFGAHRLLPGLLPPEASELARNTNLTLTVFTVAAVPVAMVVLAVAIYTIATARTREFPAEDGPPLHSHAWVQGTWLGTSSLLCIGLLVWGLVLLPPLYSPRSGKNLVVDVTGQQWQWTFSYPGEGNVTSTTLVLPVNTPVTFRVTSVDVTHSFWVPALSAKVDANPGEVTTAYVEPNRTGTYTVRCVELCGLYHAYMQSNARVVSPAEFSAWISAQQKRPA